MFCGYSIFVNTPSIYFEDELVFKALLFKLFYAQIPLNTYLTCVASARWLCFAICLFVYKSASNKNNLLTKTSIPILTGFCVRYSDHQVSYRRFCEVIIWMGKMPVLFQEIRSTLWYKLLYTDEKWLNKYIYGYVIEG